MKKLHKLPLYTLSLAFVLPLVGLFGYVYIVEKASVPEAVSKPEPQEELMAALLDLFGTESEITETGEPETVSSTGEDWREYYPVTSPMQIAGVAVEASVAKTWPERIKGLSGTPYLPERVAKVFVFDAAGFHSIWMKDMLYAIDILWVDEAGKVVHIVQDARPDSYPEIFIPEVPAMYVIEVRTGFVEAYDISINSVVTLPDFSR